jgi:hypothetical protein
MEYNQSGRISLSSIQGSSAKDRVPRLDTPMPDFRLRYASALSLAVPVVAVAVVLFSSACRRKEPPSPPVATPGVAVSHDKAPLGSPIDVTYRFVVASDARFDQDYRVMVHVVDTDEEMMFTFDHNPPIPTSQWKPGQTIEYTRTEFIPVYPYVGEASIQVGLYSTSTQKRLTLAGEDAGQRAYKVARIQLQPQTENVYTVFKDGWHQAETAEHNATVEWQWTKKDATLVFKNPKKDALFYLDVDNPGSVFRDTQRVRVSVGGQVVDEFALEAAQERLRKIPLKRAVLGNDEMSELHIAVDKTFVPALIPASNNRDPRELGVRVFHAYIDPR